MKPGDKIHYVREIIVNPTHVQRGNRMVRVRYEAEKQFVPDTAEMREAMMHYKAGIRRVNTTPPPPGQKYPPGTRVRISDDLGLYMAHFEKGQNATVRYTYAHAYGGNDVKSYCLDVDGKGEVSWYEENQLTPIAKVDTSEGRTCCSCGGTTNLEYKPEPYGQEIDGDDTPVYECSSCRNQSARDI